MDAAELEALKTSNPKAFELITSLNKEKQDAETKRKADEQKAKDDKDAKDKAGKEGEDDLQTKARKEKEAGADKVKEMRQVESALKFNIAIADFVKTNEDLLPSEIPSILRVADGENYDTAFQRATAVKVAMIQSFFKIQDNVSALTASQKTKLDDFLKLTKNGKEQEAEAIYENLFEPALETMRKVKKAEEVGKARHGFASGNKVADDYKQRLLNNSKKTHLGEKGTN